MHQTPVSLFWFRRDLRLEDNAGLFLALDRYAPVVPLFIFDSNILDLLEKNDQRVRFIYHSLEILANELKKSGTAIEVHYGKPVDIFKTLIKKYAVNHVIANTDYEPYARERDELISQFLLQNKIPFMTCKDHVIFEKNEVIKDNGEPYTVFTPYSRKWKSLFNQETLKPYPSGKLVKQFLKQPPFPFPELAVMGFVDEGPPFPPGNVSESLLAHYGENRDFPSINGTSRLGIHLRFGTISIRNLATSAAEASPVFLSELIWRDFYQQILWHFPRVGKGGSFKPAYDAIEWRNNEEEFSKWCQGLTGYPIVDAGMRQLNATGFMHNRVRMITASFLCKHLLIDWRWGEAYFAEKLLDYDLAANNGGWQWAAGSGCDASPYFRIFNPYLQTKKFDPQLKYISHWVPEYAELTYPPPMVEHVFARNRCLEVYNRSLKNN